MHFRGRGVCCCLLTLRALFFRVYQLIPGRAGDSWLVWLNKATTELALGRTDECLVDLDKARLLRGQPDVLLFANKGIALERKGDFVQALENYENAYLTRPKDVSPWWLRYSLCLYQENQVGQNRREAKATHATVGQCTCELWLRWWGLHVGVCRTSRRWRSCERSAPSSPRRTRSTPRSQVRHAFIISC